MRTTRATHTHICYYTIPHKSMSVYSNSINIVQTNIVNIRKLGTSCRFQCERCDFLIVPIMAVLPARCRMCTQHIYAHPYVFRKVGLWSKCDTLTQIRQSWCSTYRIQLTPKRTRTRTASVISRNCIWYNSLYYTIDHECPKFKLFVMRNRILPN